MTMKSPTKRFTRPRIPRPVRIARSREGARRPPGAAAPVVTRGLTRRRVRGPQRLCFTHRLRMPRSTHSGAKKRFKAICQRQGPWADPGRSQPHPRKKMPRQANSCKDTSAPTPRSADQVKTLGAGKPAAPSLLRRQKSGGRAPQPTKGFRGDAHPPTTRPPRRRCSRRTPTPTATAATASATSAACGSRASTPPRASTACPTAMSMQRGWKPAGIELDLKVLSDIAGVTLKIFPADSPTPPARLGRRRPSRRADRPLYRAPLLTRRAPFRSRREDRSLHVTSPHNQKLKQIRRPRGRCGRDAAGRLRCLGRGPARRSRRGRGWPALERFVAAGSGLRARRSSRRSCPHSALGSGTRALAVDEERWATVRGPALPVPVGCRGPWQRRYRAAYSRGLRGGERRARSRPRGPRRTKAGARAWAPCSASRWRGVTGLDELPGRSIGSRRATGARCAGRSRVRPPCSSAPSAPGRPTRRRRGAARSPTSSSAPRIAYAAIAAAIALHEITWPAEGPEPTPGEQDVDPPVPRTRFAAGTATPDRRVEVAAALPLSTFSARRPASALRLQSGTRGPGSTSRFQPQCSAHPADPGRGRRRDHRGVRRATPRGAARALPGRKAELPKLLRGVAELTEQRGAAERPPTRPARVEAQIEARGGRARHLGSRARGGARPGRRDAAGNAARSVGRLHRLDRQAGRSRTSSAASASRSRRDRRSRPSTTTSTRLEPRPRASGAPAATPSASCRRRPPGAGPGGRAAHPHLADADPGDGARPAAARDHRPGARRPPRQRRRHAAVPPDRGAGRSTRT